jgi:hypothetical protein
MNRESLLTLLLALLLLLSGCHDERRLYLLTQSSRLALPLEASHFWGFFEKEGISLRVDSASTPEELINLLNFSKYSALIADQEVASRLQRLTKRWKTVCVVAVKRERGAPIRKKTYYLLVKERLLYDTELLVKLVKGWNYGVELLKDPAVLYYLTGERELRGIKLLKCTGTHED